MKKLFFILLFLPLFSFPQDDSENSLYKLSVESVTNNRLYNDSRISDDNNVLNDSISNLIDSLLISCEDSTGFQVAVVCLDSIGENNPHDFGVELFNYWGIGDSVLNNGLLILLVIDIHKVEFITGRGTETTLTDGMSYSIQQKDMVPHFKNDDYNAGMLAGIRTVISVFEGAPPTYLIEPEYKATPEYTKYETEPSFWEKYKYTPAMRAFTKYMPFSFILVLSILVSSIFSLLILISLLFGFLSKSKPYSKYKSLNIFDRPAYPLFFPIPFILFYILLKYLKSRWKLKAKMYREEIKVSKTGNPLKRLSFEEQDILLSKNLIKEKHVKSKIIDIWATQEFETLPVEDIEVRIFEYNHVWKRRKNNNKDHGNLYYKLNQCPKCLYKTYVQLDRQQSRPVDDYYNLTIKYKCQNCAKTEEKTTKHKVYRYSRRSSSSDSDDNDSWFSNSGNSSSSSSSSSSRRSSSGSGSSGSSWGGGSSGGGGAGSSW